MRKLIKNFLYNSLYQILVVITPFIVMPHVTHALGPDNIGIYSYTNSVVIMFTTFGMLGLNTYSQREVAYANSFGKEKLSNVFKELLIIRFILFLITSFIYLSMIPFTEYKIFYFIQFFHFAYYFVDISWFFIGIEEMRNISIRNCVVKIVSTFATLFLVNNQSDLSLYILINGGCLLIGSFIMLPQIKRYIIFKHFDFKNIKNHFVPVIKLFLPQAATSLYVLFDKVMIKLITNDVSSVGFYDQSQSIVKATLIIATAFSTVVLPRVASEYVQNNNEKVKKLVEQVMDLLIICAYPIIFGIIAIAPQFIPLYLGEQFLPSVRLLQVLSLSILPIYLTNVTGIQYLTAVNKTKELTISYVFAAATNLILNFIFINLIGAIGAAISTVLAEFIVLFIQYHFVRLDLGTFKIVSKSVKCIISSLIMYLAITYIGNICGIHIRTIFIQLFVGIFIYILCMFLLKSEIFITEFSVTMKFLFQKKK